MRGRGSASCAGAAAAALVSALALAAVPVPALVSLLVLMCGPAAIDVAAIDAAAIEASASQDSVSDASGSDISAIRAAIDASAYVIVDLHEGRTVREQRREWLDTPVRPGSIAKLGTLAAALEAGTLTDATRIVCTRRVTLPPGAGGPGPGRTVDCSHPPLGRALSAVDAIAHSCNLFTATIARTLTRAQLSGGFVKMGLPPLPADADPIASALGLDGARVPPRRLIEPVLRAARGGAAVLRDGLRESARVGTASAFAEAGVDALAKTGTAPMRSGRPLGLVSAVVPADVPRYALVVALPGGSGAHAAEVAAALVAPLVGARPQPSPASVSALDPHAGPRNGTASSQGNDRVPDDRPGTIRVGRPSRAPTAASATSTSAQPAYIVETIPLEDYVSQVVAGETSAATPTAAREALAITARTYATVNRERHHADGFDVCTLTHCQVTRPASADARAAAARTRGRLLVHGDRPAAVFYSASCGGTLIDPRILLPEVDAATLPWLAARPDPAGIDERTWQTEIVATDLLGALRGAGFRGDALRGLHVQSDAAGLAARVVLDGLTPSSATGDDFRRAIGRRLGWARLRSLRFNAARTARGYRFDGRGHGHGVGLCVLGASALARRGRDADRILQEYFPGLRTTPRSEAQSADAMPRERHARRTDIQLRLPAADERARDRLRRLIERGLRDLGAQLDVQPPARVAVTVHPTGDSYRRATGRPWWTAGATIVDPVPVSGSESGVGAVRLHLAPLSALDRDRRLEQTLRHEIVHVLTLRALMDRPRWVHEGLAIHMAAGAAAASSTAAIDATTCPSDRELMRGTDRAAFQHAYARAAACVARELAAGRSWRDLGTR